jgi:hypothetical protein
MSVTSVSAGMKYEYGDATDTLVDITNEVLTINDIDQANMLQQTDPFGTSMPEYNPTGRGSFKPIQLGGIFKTGSGTVDAQFGNRIPEAVDAIARTFKITWSTGRSLSVKTQLSNFKRSPNKDNGLTRFTVELQPTGVVTETGHVTP